MEQEKQLLMHFLLRLLEIHTQGIYHDSIDGEVSILVRSGLND
jgi:hypothetical protein